MADIWQISVFAQPKHELVKLTRVKPSLFPKTKLESCPGAPNQVRQTRLDQFNVWKLSSWIWKLETSRKCLEQEIRRSKRPCWHFPSRSRWCILVDTVRQLLNLSKKSQKSWHPRWIKRCHSAKLSKAGGVANIWEQFRGENSSEALVISPLLYLVEYSNYYLGICSKLIHSVQFFCFGYIFLSIPGWCVKWRCYCERVSKKDTSVEIQIMERSTRRREYPSKR